jgi:hypothetical protein
MVVVQMGFLQTNTTAFAAYERHKLTSDAQVAAVKWQLDTNLIASDTVTDFSAEPGTRGPGGQIIFAGRYRIWDGQAAYLGFADELYCWPSYSGKYNHSSQSPSAMTNDNEQVQLLLRWSQAKNCLTMRKAEEIAESALRSIDIPISKMKLRGPKVKQQIPWTLQDGTRCMLPYYTFDWKPNTLPNQEWCKIDVSGISGTIVFFSCGSISNYVAPSNYLQLLGLSSNTVFVMPAMQPYLQGPPYKLYTDPIPAPNR